MASASVGGADDPLIQFTSLRVPNSSAAASELLPLGFLLQPLAPDVELQTLHRDADRCRHCGAYVNPFCTELGACLACAICGKPNSQWDLAGGLGARASAQPAADGGFSSSDGGGGARGGAWAELEDYAVEYVQPMSQPGAPPMRAGTPGRGAAAAASLESALGGGGGGAHAYSVDVQPAAIVLLIDEGTPAAQLAEVSGAMLELLGSLDQSTCVALLTFGAAVCAYELAHAAVTEALILPAAAGADADAAEQEAGGGGSGGGEAEGAYARGGEGHGVYDVLARNASLYLVPAHHAARPLLSALELLEAAANDAGAVRAGAADGAAACGGGGARCLGSALMAARALLAAHDPGPSETLPDGAPVDAPPPPPRACRLGASVLTVLAGVPSGGAGGLAEAAGKPGAGPRAEPGEDEGGWLGGLARALFGLGADARPAHAPPPGSGAHGAQRAAREAAAAPFWAAQGQAMAEASAAVSVFCVGHAPDFGLRTIYPIAHTTGGVVVVVKADSGAERARAPHLRACLQSAVRGRLGADATLSLRLSPGVVVTQLIGGGLAQPREADGSACAAHVLLGALHAGSTVCAALQLLPPDEPREHLVVQAVLHYTCAVTAQRRTRVLTAALPARGTTEASFLHSVQPVPTALLLAKRLSLDVLGGAAPHEVEAAVDAHARELGAAHGRELSAAERRASGSLPRARARTLAAPHLDELARLLYGARRSAALSGLLQHGDEIAAAALALAAAGLPLGMKLLEPALMRVRGVPQPPAPGGTAPAGWTLSFDRSLPPVDLCLRPEHVLVIDHGTDICVWVGEEAGAGGGAPDADAVPPWLAELSAEAWRQAVARTPCAQLLVVRDGSSMARWALARLEPLHNDPPAAQAAALPPLAAMDARARDALSARFHPTDDLSLAQWCARVRLDVPPRAGPLQRAPDLTAAAGEAERAASAAAGAPSGGRAAPPYRTPRAQAPPTRRAADAAAAAGSGGRAIAGGGGGAVEDV